MIIVGIDPGVANTGIAVINTEEKGMDARTIRPKNLGELHQAIMQRLLHIKPQIVIIEGALKFFSRSPFSHLAAYGVVTAVVELLSIPYKIYMPSQWKKILFSKGNISKKEIYQFINMKIEVETQHEADALCLAMAYIKDEEDKS